jgi:hypothetical protein
MQDHDLLERIANLEKQIEFVKNSKMNYLTAAVLMLAIVAAIPYFSANSEISIQPPENAKHSTGKQDIIRARKIEIYNDADEQIATISSSIIQIGSDDQKTIISPAGIVSTCAYEKIASIGSAPEKVPGVTKATLLSADGLANAYFTNAGIFPIINISSEFDDTAISLFAYNSIEQRMKEENCFSSMSHAFLFEPSKIKISTNASASQFEIFGNNQNSVYDKNFQPNMNPLISIATNDAGMGEIAIFGNQIDSKKYKFPIRSPEIRLSHSYGPEITISDKNQNTRINIGVDEESLAKIDIYDSNGNSRSTLGSSKLVNKKGQKITCPESTLVLFDADGKVLFEAP